MWYRDKMKAMVDRLKAEKNLKDFPAAGKRNPEGTDRENRQTAQVID